MHALHPCIYFCSRIIGRMQIHAIILGLKKWSAWFSYGKKYFEEFFLSLNIPCNWLFSIIFNQNIIFASKAKKTELVWVHRAKQNKQESPYFTVNFKTQAFCFPSNQYTNDNKRKRRPIKHNCQPGFPPKPETKSTQCQPNKIFAPFPVKCFIKQPIKHLSSYKGFPSFISVKWLQSLLVPQWRFVHCFEILGSLFCPDSLHWPKHRYFYHIHLIFSSIKWASVWQRLPSTVHLADVTVLLLVRGTGTPPWIC